ncbi:hypothetical protein Q0P28_14070, partial [Staphylococcus aureus]|nr:hypothetical protein [Staphylococcus aureus]
KMETAGQLTRIAELAGQTRVGLRPDPNHIANSQPARLGADTNHLADNLVPRHAALFDRPKLAR